MNQCDLIYSESPVTRFVWGVSVDRLTLYHYWFRAVNILFMMIPTSRGWFRLLHFCGFRLRHLSVAKRTPWKQFKKWSMTAMWAFSSTCSLHSTTSGREKSWKTRTFGKWVLYPSWWGSPYINRELSFFEVMPGLMLVEYRFGKESQECRSNIAERCFTSSWWGGGREAVVR